MKKLAATVVLIAVGLVAPAQASKPDRPAKPAKPAKAAKGKCATRSVGFNAAGTLLTSTLTMVEPGRYSGTISVHVTRANHGAPKGEQTFTLTNARMRFHVGVDAAAPAVGSRVKLSGKISKLNRKCPAGGSVPTVTVKKVNVQPAEIAGAGDASEVDAE